MLTMLMKLVALIPIIFIIINIMNIFNCTGYGKAAGESIKRSHSSINASAFYTDINGNEKNKSAKIAGTPIWMIKMIKQQQHYHEKTVAGIVKTKLGEQKNLPVPKKDQSAVVAVKLSAPVILGKKDLGKNGLVSRDNKNKDNNNNMEQQCCLDCCGHSGAGEIHRRAKRMAGRCMPCNEFYAGPSTQCWKCEGALVDDDPCRRATFPNDQNCGECRTERGCGHLDMLFYGENEGKRHGRCEWKWEANECIWKKPDLCIIAYMDDSLEEMTCEDCTSEEGCQHLAQLRHNQRLLLPGVTMCMWDHSEICQREPPSPQDHHDQHIVYSSSSTNTED